eukprot:6485403-Amphidinium_carterae.1
MMPKVLYLPVNTMMPPPISHGEGTTWERGLGDTWLQHCSLSAIVEMLEAHVPKQYVLLHLEHFYAVFVLRSILDRLRLPAHRFAADGAHDFSRLWDEWYYGWLCSPVARYAHGLELSMPEGFFPAIGYAMQGDAQSVIALHQGHESGSLAAWHAFARALEDRWLPWEPGVDLSSGQSQWLCWPKCPQDRSAHVVLANNGTRLCWFDTCSSDNGTHVNIGIGHTLAAYTK